MQPSGQKLYLFNTLTRSKDPFVALRPGVVDLYCCGPTVYHFAHIGNLRTYVFEDVLVRTLERAGFKVNHVMNITDVGHLVSDGDHGADKMEEGSKREGRTAWEIADYYTKVFFSDLERLNVRPPRANMIPKATEFVPQMIELIQELEAKGFTYKTSDGIYYDTKKFPAYGKLAKLDIDNLNAGARVEMKEKRSHTDFALWKFSPANEKRQMEWESPWGRGFPGWHIECSAMARAKLGVTIDIHCGGKDHIPVHHTNEIAQTEAATGKQFSRWWMHGEFLTEDKGKMSKSAGTFLTLQALIDQGYDPLAYRFLILQAHYRSELNFHFEALKSAQAGLEGLRNRIAALPDAEKIESPSENFKSYRARFDAALFDDLNTAVAVSVLFEALRADDLSDGEKAALVVNLDEVLGLNLDPATIRKSQENQVTPPEVQALMKARDQARQSKNWAESDRLRKEIEALGYQVLDSASGTVVKRKVT